MNTKQRDVILQRWSGAIRRETRDLASLEHIGARALADSDVRDDPTLQAMIRADLSHRRAELEHEMQSSLSPTASPASRAQTQPVASDRLATPPEEVREAFNKMALAICVSLEGADESETDVIFGKMRALQEENPEAIPAAVLAEYEQRVELLRGRFQQLRDEIEALAEQAVSAARSGSKENLAKAMHRLTAIHAAHAALLDEAGLETIRVSAIRAADERRQTLAASRKLVERSRAIAAEIKTLAAAVREFHRVACTVPETSDMFRQAEAKYLRTIQEVRSYDADWFSGVVLELADLLAEWNLPPLGAEGQIDRFLDSISAGLKNIRAEMREIEREQEP